VQCLIWYKADIPAAPAFVRYWGRADKALTQSGHYAVKALLALLNC
jgi:hypothetical protein